MKDTYTFKYETREGVEVERELPATIEICGTCRGKGKHSLALGAITQEDREQNWSQGELGDYMNGAYDQACEVCQGKGRVVEPDLGRWPADLREMFERAEDERILDESIWRMENRCYGHDW